MGIPASMRARVEAFRSVDKREPSEDRTVKVRVMRECGYRFRRRSEERDVAIVVCSSEICLSREKISFTMISSLKI